MGVRQRGLGRSGFQALGRPGVAQPQGNVPSVRAPHLDMVQVPYRGRQREDT